MRTRDYVGVTLIALGVPFLASAFFQLGFIFGMPLAMCTLGVALLTTKGRNE